MFLSLWNDSCTIFSYFEHLRVCGEARKISRNSKNRWFLELRSKRSLTASKWDMNIIFLITERYNVKFGKFTWKNMEGRMAGRYMNHESRYTLQFSCKNWHFKSQGVSHGRSASPSAPPWYRLVNVKLRYLNNVYFLFMSLFRPGNWFCNFKND